eukprot:13790272-Ditylum_brightwellii.AAC.2
MKHQKKSYAKRHTSLVYFVPRIGDVRGAMKLDMENGNSIWFDACKKEASTLKNMDTGDLMPENFNLTGYQYALLIYTYDV